jgi:recombination protein RecR
MKQIESLENLVNMFRSLPGVGAKTAQRYAYKIINSEKEYAENFSSAILDAKNKIKYCAECGNFTDTQVCSICSTRNPKIICVVNGVYQVLHVTINPLVNRGPNYIRIK